MAGSLGTGSAILLIASVVVALGFEFVNGFHDTANAVATVIYTNTLKPLVAVILSGFCNFLGVFAGGIAVAMAIVHLLPVELLVESGAGAGLAMVLALLVAAMLWNLGTWYLGLPASSSHTLIGAILGCGLAHSTLPGHVFGDGVDWDKSVEVGLSLLLSPLVGFGLSYLLYAFGKRFDRDGKMTAPAKQGEPPPGSTRAILVATCASVSFAHGSNDGQKGVGLIMLILIGLLPGSYALDDTLGRAELQRAASAIERMETLLDAHVTEGADVEGARAHLVDLRERLAAHESVAAIPAEARFPMRADILVAEDDIDALLASGALHLDEAGRAQLASDREVVRGLTEYAPLWVLIAVALALGVGTTIGWKRIVVTVGEKIGKTHLSYGQGASAEVVAAASIGLSSFFGLPVSTTHVLSSGIAGTMVAQGSGLQGGTVKKIALAWVLTLPAAMILAGLLFRLFLLFA